jgi:hypothetical protein
VIKIPKEKYLVCFDVQHAGAGYDAPAEYKKSTTGKTAGKPYEAGQAFGTSNGTVGKGFSAQVFAGKITEVEAESVEEACIVAREAYGAKYEGGAGSFAGVCIASKGKEYEWKSV